MEHERNHHSFMRGIHWLSPDDEGEWDAFVNRHPLGLVYHLSSWQRVLESAFGHIRGQFLVLRDGDGQIQAGLPVYTVRSWFLGNRIVSVPFATMCDPLVSTKEEFNMLWAEVENESKKHQTRRIEIRTRHINTYCMPTLLTPNERYKHHYLLLDKPEDELFRSFHKSTIRQRVNKARREGVIVEERNDEKSLRELHKILVVTRRRRSLPPIPFAFFQAMLRLLPSKHIALYLALHAEKTVGGHLVLKFKDMWSSEYAGAVDNAIPGVSCRMPQGAMYAFPNVKSFGKTSDWLANYLLEDAGVALLPGTSFGPGGEGYLRLCFASAMTDIETGVARIADALSRL